MGFLKYIEHLSIKKAFGLLFLIFATLLIVGCSNNNTTDENSGEAEETVDQSEQAIRAVIEKEFNGPDEKYKELLDSVGEAQMSDKYKDDYEAFLESPEHDEMMSYMKETYASYFTENGYDSFINETPAFLYSGYDHDYELSTSNIEIVQSENGDTLYDFTFQVEYTDSNGESSQYDFVGNAIAPEEGEIGDIHYTDEGQKLIEELRNNE